MTAERKFYVYEHIRSDTGEVFYVGKGQGGRSEKLTRPNPHHRNVTAKLKREGGEVVVRHFRNGMSEPCAFSLERALILFRKQQGNRLANMTNGGEGSAGYVPTAEEREATGKRTSAMWADPETRGKLCASLSRWAGSASGKIHQSTASLARWAKPGAKARQAEGTTELWKDPSFRGRVQETHRKRYSNPEFAESHRNSQNHRKTAVVCLTTNEYFRGVREAARARGVFSSKVGEVCRGKRKSVNGLVFAYAEEYCL